MTLYLVAQFTTWSSDSLHELLFKDCFWWHKVSRSLYFQLWSTFCLPVVRQTGRLLSDWRVEGHSEQVTFHGRWMERCIIEMGRIMSGVPIHHGNTRRREERRSGCQRQILCQNGWQMREGCLLGWVAGQTIPVPEAEQEETRPTQRPWLTPNLEGAGLLLWGKLNGKQIACSLGLHKSQHVLINLFDWQMWEYQMVRSYLCSWQQVGHPAAIHLLSSLIQLIYQAYPILHSPLTPLFSPNECVYFEGVLNRQKVLFLAVIIQEESCSCSTW